ncbi:MAG TPA: FAD-dependent oxidoreductase [Planctomycetaceae bacterium]|nr:FAD-dependent oxidoreductase [Planctomycetaceae bacterium]
MRIAIIGTGVSGLLAARLMASKHDVRVFEANGYLGGHARMEQVEIAGRRCVVDTGFMVFNEATYPNFCQLLRLLGVPAQNTDMSFSVRCARSGLEYQGSSLNGLFAQRSNLLSPRFYGMLRDIIRFNLQAEEILAQPSTISLGAYLKGQKYSTAFIEHYLLPMSAAIWSCPPHQVLQFPLFFLVRFLSNHGLLQLRNRPQWKTIVGGSQEYIRPLMQPLQNHIRMNCPIVSVRRNSENVLIQSSDGREESFDYVIMALHADQALAVLRDSDALESEILASFPYHENVAVLHTDHTILPKRRRSWASWNYHLGTDANRPVSVTYDLGRLQKLDLAKPLLLTLNPTESIRPDSILKQIKFQHPAYDTTSIAAQQRRLECQGTRRTFFCGAYWGNGFHEDGVNSALSIAEFFGITMDACTISSTKDASNIADMTR